MDGWDGMIIFFFLSLWDQFVRLLCVLISYQCDFRYRWWTSSGHHRRLYVSIPSRGKYIHAFISRYNNYFSLESLVRHPAWKWNHYLVFQMKNQAKRKKQIAKVTIHSSRLFFIFLTISIRFRLVKKGSFQTNDFTSNKFQSSNSCNI